MAWIVYKPLERKSMLVRVLKLLEITLQRKPFTKNGDSKMYGLPHGNPDTKSKLAYWRTLLALE